MSNLLSPLEEKYVNKKYCNTRTDLIEITEDKLENIVIKYIVRLRKGSAWLTPFSLVITIGITLLTTEVNKDLFGIPRAVWTACFYLVLLASFLWLIHSIVNSIKYRKESDVPSLIQSIKNVDC